MHRYFGDGSIQSEWLRMGASHGDEVWKCYRRLGRIGPYPGKVPGTHIFYTPLPKRLGKPKSEDSKLKLFKHIEAVSPY